MTKNGTDPLLPKDENCADIVDPPTEAEMDAAITGNMGHLLVVMKAVKRFKALLLRNKRSKRTEGFLGRESRLVAPPHAMRGESKSVSAHDRKPVDGILVAAGVHRDVEINDAMEKLPHDLDKAAVRSPLQAEIYLDSTEPGRQDHETKAHYMQRLETAHHRPGGDPDFHPVSVGASRAHTFPANDHAKGHAHDPLMDTIFLSIGAHNDEQDEQADESVMSTIVSESPPGFDGNIYEQAYQEEMKRIIEHKGQSASIYLTRRVEHNDDIRSHSNVLDSSKNVVQGLASHFGGMVLKSDTKKSGLAALIKQAQAQEMKGPEPKTVPEGSQSVVLDRQGDTAARVEELGGQRSTSAPLDIPGAFPVTPGVEER